MVVVPLMGSDRPVGVLKVMSAEPGHFTGQHVAILQLMAGFIASVMHSASAFEHNQMQAHHDGLTGLANRALFEGTPFGLAEGPLEVRASVGFAVTNDPGIGPEGLLEQADRAMYEEKRGRGRRKQAGHHPV